MEQLHKIKKKIRRSKLKQMFEFYSELFMIFLVLLLMGLCLYFVFLFDAGK